MQHTKHFFLFVLLLVCSCSYEHSNPIDPDYSGIRTRLISIVDFQIDDNNYDGSGDSEINPGEKVKIYVSVMNTGNSIAENVSAEVKTNNNFISVLSDYFEKLNWGDVFPDSTSDGKEGVLKPKTKACVEIQVDKNIQDDKKFTLYFFFKDKENNSCEDSLSLVVNKLGNILSIVKVSLTETTPDVYSRYFILKPYIKNISNSNVTEVNGKLFEDDDNVGIWGKSGNFGDINAGDTVTTNYPYDFRISIPKSLKTPYDALFYLELSDKFGNVWRDSTIVSIE